MTTLHKAAQQALEALEKYRQMMFAEAGCRWDAGDAAITALRAALAQEQAEPTFKDSLQVEPVATVAENATVEQPVGDTPPSDYRRGYWDGFAIGKREGRIEAEDATKQADPKGGGNLPPPLRETEQFDHGIGANRYKVVRGAYWWHVLIGDGQAKHGKFHTQACAEEMAALLLREFRNGAFVQHEAEKAQEQAEPPTNQCGETCERAKLCAACARELEEPTGKQDLHVEPEQEPVAKVELMMTGGNAGLATRIVEIDDHLRERLRPGQLLYTAPPQRKPLTEEEIERHIGYRLPAYSMRLLLELVNGRAHGIGGDDGQA